MILLANCCWNSQTECIQTFRDDMIIVYSQSTCSLLMLHKHNWCFLSACFPTIPVLISFFPPSLSEWERKCSACSPCWIQANMLPSHWTVRFWLKWTSTKVLFCFVFFVCLFVCFFQNQTFDYFASCQVWDFEKFAAYKQLMGSVSDTAISSTRGCWSLRPTKTGVMGLGKGKAALWCTNSFISLNNMRCSISLNEHYL